VVSYGRNVDKSHTYKLVDSSNQDTTLERGEKIKDLGVWFDEKLTFKEHINQINVAYMMLGLIKRNFKYVTIPTFVMLYKSMVRSHLDYCCCSVWTPYRKGDIEALEKVQEESNKDVTSIEKSPI